MVLRIGLLRIRIEISRLQEPPEQRAARRVRAALQDPEQYWNESRERALRYMMLHPGR